MPDTTKTLAILATLAVAMTVSAPAAQAKHRHHRAHSTAAVAPMPAKAPAHQNPNYVGVASASLPGIVDLGLGPVFPFAGWPK